MSTYYDEEEKKKNLLGSAVKSGLDFAASDAAMIGTQAALGIDDPLGFHPIKTAKTAKKKAVETIYKNGGMTKTAKKGINAVKAAKKAGLAKTAYKGIKGLKGLTAIAAAVDPEPFTKTLLISAALGAGTDLIANSIKKKQQEEEMRLKRGY